MSALVKFGKTYFFFFAFPLTSENISPSGEIVRSLRTGRYQPAKTPVRSKLGEVENKKPTSGGYANRSIRSLFIKKGWGYGTTDY
jgi:hypothetical protein